MVIIVINYLFEEWLPKEKKICLCLNKIELQEIHKAYYVLSEEALKKG